MRLSDGSIRNGYTIRVANKKLDERRYALTIDGLADAKLDIVGGTVDQQGRAVIAVGPDQTLEARVLVTVQGSPIPTSTDVHFILMDLTNGDSVRMNDHFKAP